MKRAVLDPPGGDIVQGDVPKMQRMESERRRVAIYGGSFNPITNAHLNAASECIHSSLVDEVWITPCGPRPDKPSLKTSTLERLVMCHLAVDTTYGSRFGIKVCDEETRYAQALPAYILMKVLGWRTLRALQLYCGSLGYRYRYRSTHQSLTTLELAAARTARNNAPRARPRRGSRHQPHTPQMADERYVQPPRNRATTTHQPERRVLNTHEPSDDAVHHSCSHKPTHPSRQAC